MKNKKKTKVDLLTVQETAQSSGYKDQAVREWVGKGLIPHVRIGNSIRIPVDAFERFIASRTVPAKEKE
jgi:excisionase family DNA binding protein